MMLVLELTQCSASQLGRESRLVLRGRGATIGGAPPCDWVLPGLPTGRLSVLIEFAHGRFTLTSLGLCAVCRGQPGAALIPLQPYPLRDGEPIWMGEYCMSAMHLDEDGLPFPAAVTAEAVGANRS